MYINRLELKRRAKQLIRSGSPNPMMIALIFLLATTWLSAVLDLVVENPLNKFTEVYTQWSQMMSAGDSISPAMMDAMKQQMMGCFQGTEAVVGLLLAVLVSLYSLVVQMGYYSHSLQKVRGEETPIGELFAWFGMAGKIIWLQILRLIFIYLWCLLFLIPGIIAMYRYRMADYCLLDDPDISALEAIRRSKAMMKGRKADLFSMDLSFFGWLFLEMFTASFVGMFVQGLLQGLLGAETAPVMVVTLVSLLVTTAFSVYLVPYMHYSYAGYYQQLKEMPKAPPVYPGAPQPPVVPPTNPPRQDPWDRAEPEHPKDDSDNEGWNQ